MTIHDYMTTRDFANALREEGFDYSTRAITRWCESDYLVTGNGELAAVKVGGSWLIHHEALKTFTPPPMGRPPKR